MKVRIGLTMSGMRFDHAADLWAWVDACEASRVDSLWQSDRLIGSDPHIEAMSFMAALAGRTQRLKFGTSVVAISFRDPLVLAKAGGGTCGAFMRILRQVEAFDKRTSLEPTPHAPSPTKFQQALADAQSIAVGNDKQFIEPVHLLLAMLGRTMAARVRCCSAPAPTSPPLKAALDKAIERLPKVEGAGGEISVSAASWATCSTSPTRKRRSAATSSSPARCSCSP
jgi:hypothetical protein